MFKQALFSLKKKLSSLKYLEIAKKVDKDKRNDTKALFQAVKSIS